MTTTTTAPAQQRSKRARRRSWWADGLEAAMWLAIATGVSLMIASGGLLTVSSIDYVYAGGRILGIAAAIMMMTQVLLASRAPFIERAIGHDVAMAKHTRLGTWAIFLMVGHMLIITAVTAEYDGKSFLEQSLAWGSYGWFLLFAQIAIAAFTVVLITSITAVMRRWNYEAWHGVHLLVYVGIAFAVPHQFLEGTTFRDGGAAWWFWAVLYVAAFAPFIWWRLICPAVLAARHQVRVETVASLPDGSTSVTMSGRNLRALGAKPGQFFLWRFWAPGLATQAHPYSLSAAPGDTLRITVKPSGNGSSAVADLKPGTKVWVEGPLGVFTDAARSGNELLLIAAGVGITPIRSMLEEARPEDNVTVVVRARSRDEAPLLDEVEELAAATGATLHVLVGSRGDTWGTAQQPASISDFTDAPALTDVFVCGPQAWAQTVAADAAASGVPADAIHREEFAW